jgi:hypothetical protein
MILKNKIGRSERLVFGYWHVLGNDRFLKKYINNLICKILWLPWTISFQTKKLRGKIKEKKKYCSGLLYSEIATTRFLRFRSPPPMRTQQKLNCLVPFLFLNFPFVSFKFTQSNDRPALKCWCPTKNMNPTQPKWTNPTTLNQSPKKQAFPSIGGHTSSISCQSVNKNLKKKKKIWWGRGKTYFPK